MIIINYAVSKINSIDFVILCLFLALIYLPKNADKNLIYGKYY